MTALQQELAETLHSPAMQDVFKIAKRVSNSDLGILITGEFGSGKEWLARRIHMLSMRSGKPFITVDFSTIPQEALEAEIFGHESGDEVEKGLLEDVNGGTILFGGFSTIAADIQAKVARAVEHQKYHRVGGRKDVWFNGRIIVAEKIQPTPEMSAGAAQRDIYSRLVPIVIELPPLRERQEDIFPLIHRFISSSNERNRTSVVGINSPALDLCLKHQWRGNIRELRNTIEYAVIMAQKQMIQPAHLPLQVRGGRIVREEPITPRTSMNVMEVERILIEHALRQAPTKKEAARLLGISVKTLYNKLNRYQLSSRLVSDQELKPESEEVQNDSD